MLIDNSTTNVICNCLVSLIIHAHTHTHTHKYIYIERKRVREKEREKIYFVFSSKYVCF